MLQLLRGSKLPRRLLSALYRRTIALLLHIVKHPVKTVFFIIKVYLLLMLFSLCLAFSFGSFAQESGGICTEGGQWIPELNGCGIIKPDQSCKVTLVRGTAPNDQWTQLNLESVSLYNNYVSGVRTGNDPNADLVCGQTSVSRTYSSDLSYNCTGPVTSFPVDHTITTTTLTRSRPGIVNGQCAAASSSTNETVSPRVARITAILTDDFECEDPWTGEATVGLNTYCYYVPEQPCDCSDLTGTNPQGINYFYTTPGTYSQASPPNCINRDDNENSDVPNCNCKLIATKWASADVNINGTLYTRWQPIPDYSGITGVFTGGQCDESEKDIPPDEPEECYNLGNGQRFCLEDPDKKCAKIDGIMTCETGCGSVNGEFFCFEDEPPEEEIPDPNDDITDPDKPLNNMIKQDFKDVLGGTEQRLDILSKLLSQIKTDSGKGDGLMASKQDATNRLLKEISDKLDDEGGDDETPTNPQPTYNTDKLEEFVNPNDWGEKNFRTVATAFKERMMQTPIMQAVQGFFDVALSGSCPTWQTTVSMPFGGSFTINIDQLCSEAMNNIWPSIRAIIILIFTFLAFRVAFTNE